jgi:hypothetical protein
MRQIDNGAKIFAVTRDGDQVQMIAGNSAACEFRALRSETVLCLGDARRRQCKPCTKDEIHQVNESLASSTAAHDLTLFPGVANHHGSLAV